MSHISRTVTTSVLDWRGVLVRVIFERQTFGDRLQVETIEPARAPLPITETGYLSSFVSKGVIDDAGDPASYVEALLDRSAKASRWGHIGMEVRQHALF